MKRVFAIIACVICMGCTDPQGTTEILRSQGYHDIKITGYKFFAGGRDDWWQTGFIASTRDNVVVSGSVCKGILKGSTIRFD